jgi:hypothetical protein
MMKEETLEGNKASWVWIFERSIEVIAPKLGEYIN